MLLILFTRTVQFRVGLFVTAIISFIFQLSPILFELLCVIFWFGKVSQISWKRSGRVCLCLGTPALLHSCTPREDVTEVVEVPLEPGIDSGNRSNLAIACETSYRLYVCLLCMYILYCVWIVVVLVDCRSNTLHSHIVMSLLIQSNSIQSNTIHFNRIAVGSHASF